MPARLRLRAVPVAARLCRPLSGGPRTALSDGADAAAKPSGAAAAAATAALPQRMAVAFTCGPCGARVEKGFSRSSYERGVVIVRCPGCQELHMIADNEGRLGDRFNIEQAGAVRRTAAEGDTEAGREALERFARAAEAAADARQFARTLLKQKPERAADLLRAGWHAGSRGGVRVGDRVGAAILKPFSARFPGALSESDLLSAGAVEAAESLGVLNVEWLPGRVDGVSGARRAVPDAAATADELRETFAPLGFDDAAALALAAGYHGAAREGAAGEVTVGALDELYAAEEMPEAAAALREGGDGALRAAFGAAFSQLQATTLPDTLFVAAAK